MAICDDDINSINSIIQEEQTNGNNLLNLEKLGFIKKDLTTPLGMLHYIFRKKI